LTISVIIPAFNEEKSIAEVVEDALPRCDEVLVIDDGSTDNTAHLAREAGATVISQARSGYIPAVKSGFVHAKGDVFVTLDADGEHKPEEIPLIIEPIVSGEADMVLGARPEIPRISERVISALCSFRLGVRDIGTGFRAMRRELALAMNFPGVCICGTSVLEACSLGARVVEVPISSGKTTKPRKIAWKHVIQLFYVLKMMFEKTERGIKSNYAGE